MRIVFMGPPGAGKGTQAALIAQQLSVPHISTGDIFRANVSALTELGIAAKRYMDAGEYVPEVYADQTAPLTAIYENREILKQVDGLGDIDEITNRILSALAVNE